MNKTKVGVIGYGTVGKGMASLFRAPVAIHDPAQGFDELELINAECGLAIVCVPTPQTETGEADTTIVEAVVRELETPYILIKSTVPPGTTDALAERYDKRIAFSPEYLGESTYFTAPWKYPDPDNPRSHDFFIVGGEWGPDIWEFFKSEMGVDTRVGFCSNVEAELTKYMENTYFATKVTFCNEWADIAASYGVEYDRLRELWLMDPRVERMHTAVFKGKRGYGGKCYPKDISAIVSEAYQRGVNVGLLSQVIQRNADFHAD